MKIAQLASDAEFLMTVVSAYDFGDGSAPWFGESANTAVANCFADWQAALPIRAVDLSENSASSFSIPFDPSFNTVLMSSWDDTVIPTPTYFRTYPGDAIYTAPPYALPGFMPNDTISPSDYGLSDPGDDAIFQASVSVVNTEYRIITTRGGFVLNLGLSGGSAGSNGPRFFFVDPLWDFYWRFTVIGGDTSSIAALNLWVTKAVASATNHVRTYVVYDGSAWWLTASYSPLPYATWLDGKVFVARIQQNQPNPNLKPPGGTNPGGPNAAPRGFYPNPTVAFFPKLLPAPLKILPPASLSAFALGGQNGNTQWRCDPVASGTR